MGGGLNRSSSSNGNNNNNNGNNSNNNLKAKKNYGVIVILAFGAALFGLLVLHKLRESRILTLLVHEKDHDLLSLHLLLQREREFNKQTQKRIEDMRTKLYTLWTKNAELKTQNAELQSTISGLKDEIKLLRDRDSNSSTEILQLAALLELLKQKEDEIDELKLHLEKPTGKVTSVSSKNSTVTVVKDENEGQNDTKRARFGEVVKLDRATSNGSNSGLTEELKKEEKNAKVKEDVIVKRKLRGRRLRYGFYYENDESGNGRSRNFSGERASETKNKTGPRIDSVKEIKEIGSDGESRLKVREENANVVHGNGKEEEKEEEKPAMETQKPGHVKDQQISRVDIEESKDEEGMYASKDEEPEDLNEVELHGKESAEEEEETGF